jgi:hypothetical protein
MSFRAKREWLVQVALDGCRHNLDGVLANIASQPGAERRNHFSSTQHWSFFVGDPPTSGRDALPDVWSMTRTAVLAAHSRDSPRVSWPEAGPVTHARSRNESFLSHRGA